MAQITVRNISPDVVTALKMRAAKSGRSAEAEHRRILEEALIEGRSSHDFFAEARRQRVRLPAGAPDTRDLLRQDRDRDPTDR